MADKEHVPNSVGYVEPEMGSIPGITEPKENAGVSVYNIPTPPVTPPSYYASGNASVPGTTGVQYVTGLGFQPKMVVLHGTHPGGGSVGFCDGVMTATHEYCRYLYFNNAGPSAVPYLGSGAVAIYLTDPYTQSRAVKDGLNANGFSLNWTSVGLTGCSYHWEAYG